MKSHMALPNLHLNLVCLSAAYLAIGAVMLVFPHISPPVLCGAIGMAAIIAGIISIAFYFIRKGFLYPDQAGFAAGTAMILVGAFAVIRPDNFADALVQILALFMIGDGIIKLQFSMDLLRLKSAQWWLILIVALTTTGLAMAILLFPFDDAFDQAIYTDLILLVDGAVNIVTVAFLHRRLKKYQTLEH